MFCYFRQSTRRKTKIKNQLAVHVFLTFKNTENRLLQQRQNTYKYQRQSGSLCHFHTHQNAKNSTESTSKASNHKASFFTYGITGIQDKFITRQIVRELLFAGNLQTRVFSFLSSRYQ